VDAEACDSWYRTPRGKWIGGTEFRLLRALLRPERCESLLDVGCGTGHFTRRFALDLGLDRKLTCGCSQCHAGGSPVDQGVGPAVPQDAECSPVSQSRNDSARGKQ
jgi:hypothetical protein